MRTCKCCRIKDNPLNEFSCLVIAKAYKSFFYRFVSSVPSYYSLSDQRKRNKQNIKISLSLYSIVISS